MIDSVLPGQTISNLASGSYIGIVTNEWGCTARDTLIVENGSEDCIIIPNTVTPNGDGYNDVFAIFGGCGYDSFKICIYNKFGDEIYQSSDCNFFWNPLSDNAMANTVYYYYLKLVQGNKIYEKKSSINVQY